MFEVVVSVCQIVENCTGNEPSVVSAFPATLLSLASGRRLCEKLKRNFSQAGRRIVCRTMSSWNASLLHPTSSPLELNTSGGEVALNADESAVAVVVYTLITVVAVIGNATVIFIIGHFPRLRTPTNALIANLALADLLMALLCIPFSFVSTLILQYWPFGWFLCKVINFSQAVTVMASAYTLIAISLDRFFAILLPMSPNVKMTNRKATLCVLVVWTVAIVIAFPLLMVLTLEPSETGDVTHCIENWTWTANANETTGEYEYSLAAMLLQYFVPLLVLTLTYAGIGMKIWFTHVPGEGGYAGQCNRERKTLVKKMIPTMFIVTAVYTFCWLPINVFNVVRALHPSVTDSTYVLHIWWACHTIAMVHCLVNPIIYICRNRRFREGFAFVFQWLPGVHYDRCSLSMFSTSVARSSFQASIVKPLTNTSSIYGKQRLNSKRRC
ncbi:Neuropeptide Y receptor [Trichinella zimbabwensis]|uniref:Neuropeptide Y receptor n=2 Tax=Trichinella zimbabwensis TaxID=268475 RepID=A0A0V1HHG8_9BILA|nr:Neuropeptide Y receptor [Trichinella zimbabwensis]